MPPGANCPLALAPDAASPISGFAPEPAAAIPRAPIPAGTPCGVIDPPIPGTSAGLPLKPGTPSCEK